MNSDYYKNFIKQLNETLSSQKKPTIMIAGYVGCGKTTLAANILGKNIVPEEAIGHCESTTKGFIDYGDDYINIIDSQGFEPPMTQDHFLEFIKTHIKAKQLSNNIQDHVHLIWYCIEGPKARITPTDIDLINKILPKESTILVITKMDITKKEQKKALTDKLLKSTEIPSSRILYVSEEEKESLENLVKTSDSILPQAYRAAFMSKQKVILEEKQIQASKCIRNYAIGLGIVGIAPFIDVPFIVGFQYKMIKDLAQIYGFNSEEIEEFIGYSTAAVITGSAFGGSLLDLSGPIGWLVGGFSAGTITGGLGMIVSDYFYRCSEAIMAGKDIKEIPKLKLTKDELQSSAVKFKESF
ncbi:MAG: GTPase [Cyanobacteria bacterium P01_F01_bin.143]